ncbi:MAG: FadR/GntR family transcriptional regulator [Acidimicrobiales bacterium]
MTAQALPVDGPIERSALFDQIAARLEELVLSGELKMGSKLPSEGALAIHFGVSRPVIREALAQLRERGLIETLNGNGTFVRQPDSEHLADVLLRHLRFAMTDDESVIANLYEARTAVETMAAHLAATRASEQDRAAILGQLDAMRESRGDPASWTRADLGFHVAIAAGSRNPFLTALLTPLTRIMEQSISESHSDPEAVMSGLASHQAIWAAIQEGDGDAAAAAMRSHLADSRKRLVGVLLVGIGRERTRTSTRLEPAASSVSSGRAQDGPG